MQTEIIIAGFGGQGVLFAGQLLSYAAMDAGKQVTWFPSYGPEMRGGTANCTVVISDEEIGSPMVLNPMASIVMSLPALEKYEPLIKPGGVLIVSTSTFHQPVERTDLRTVYVPSVEIAEEIGNKRLSNMVLLGALLANLPVLPLDALEQALSAHLPSRHKHLLQQNLQAMERGANLVAV